MGECLNQKSRPGFSGGFGASLRGPVWTPKKKWVDMTIQLLG